MNSFVCQIHRLKTAPTKAIIMTVPLMKKLGCTAGTSVRLCCGNKEVITRVVQINNKPGDAIYLPPSIASELALPSVSKTRIAFHGIRALVAGVLVVHDAVLLVGRSGHLRRCVAVGPEVHEADLA